MHPIGNPPYSQAKYNLGGGAGEEKRLQI